jgi:hypothetical protein
MQPYKFLSGEDPTDEQLAELMHAVAVEVRERAKQAEAKYKAHLTETVHNTLLKYGITQKNR